MELNSSWRYFLLILGIGVLYAFVHYGQSGSIPEAGTPSTTATTPMSTPEITESDAPGYMLYTDRGIGFTFAFPSNFSVAPNPSDDPEVLATITVPREYQLGTNFSDAKFTVNASAIPSNVANCLVSPVTSQSSSPVRVAIGGVAFTKIVYSDAAAGNRYDTTSYRTVRNKQCYAVEHTIHYGAIQNYPPGTVKEFDEALVERALDEVAQSFEFLK